MNSYTPPLTVHHIAADLCRELLADRPTQPLALQDPDRIWPPRYERTPACPEIKEGAPAGPCVLLKPGDYALFVAAFTGREWVQADADWMLAYPDGFGPFRCYPPDARLGIAFRVELVRRIERRLALLTSRDCEAATVPAATDAERH